MSFSGSQTYSMDSKGRIAIPAKFREQMTPADLTELRLAQAIGEPYLKLYGKQAWATLQEKIDAITNPTQRQAFRRVIVGGAHLVSLDAQGRILIPPVLRDYAALGGEVVVVGEIDHIQFWAPENWNRNFDQAVDVMRNSGALLAELGF